MPWDPDKCDIEAHRKKVEIAATFPDNCEVIHNVRKRSYGSLTIRNYRDAVERNTVVRDPLSSPVDGHYFRLKHATIIRQLKGNIQVLFQRVDSS